MLNIISNYMFLQLLKYICDLNLRGSSVMVICSKTPQSHVV